MLFFASCIFDLLVKKQGFLMQLLYENNFNESTPFNYMAVSIYLIYLFLDLIMDSLGN